MPNGIVATTQNAYVKLRSFLVEDSLVAVVSLPAGVFKPYSGVKTSILLLDKKLARQTKEILFLKITADGFDLGDKRNPIEANDLPEAERVVKAWFAGKLDESTTTSVAWKAVEKKTLARKPLGQSSVRTAISVRKLRESSFEIVKLGDVARNHLWPVAAWRDATTNPAMVFRSTKARLTSGEIWLDAAPRLDNRGNQAVRDAMMFVMSRSRTSGKRGVNLCTQEICIGRGLAAIRPSETLLRDYLFYFLRNNQDRIRGGDGAVFPSISRDQIAEIEIPLPPLEEQRRIVAEIEGYQKVLDGARQILDGYKPPRRHRSRLGIVPSLVKSAQFKTWQSTHTDEMRRHVLLRRVPGVLISKLRARLAYVEQPYPDWMFRERACP